MIKNEFGIPIFRMFENCKINVPYKTYTNVNNKFYETPALPNLIRKIKEKVNATWIILKLEKLYIKKLQRENNIELLVGENRNVHVISLNTDIIFIILVIIVACILVYISMQREKFSTNI